MKQREELLVGRKVNLSVTEVEYGKDENKKIYKRYEVVDPDFEKEVNSITSENRIFPPGTAGTMDFKPYRLNVYINKDGIVEMVNYG